MSKFDLKFTHPKKLSSLSLFPNAFSLFRVGSPNHKSPRSSVLDSRFFEVLLPHVFYHSCCPSRVWSSSSSSIFLDVKCFSTNFSQCGRHLFSLHGFLKIFLQWVWLSYCLWYVCFVLCPIVSHHQPITAFTKKLSNSNKISTKNRKTLYSNNHHKGKGSMKRK